MPTAARHMVSWCQDDGRYELVSGNATARRLGRGETAAWQSWLVDGVTAFTFRGAVASLGVYHEPRSRGGRYWYAYHSAAGQTRKRYLGATGRVTLARLEEVAAILAGVAAPGGITAPSDPPPVDDLAGAFPATKLAPPQAPPALVARAGLLDALDAAFATPLTLVAAPAGWGKTTTLAAWARRHPARVAWLSLEAADDEPVRFWAATITALRARLPGVGATALALLRAPRPPPLPVVVTALVNELAGPRQAAPLALVLDDYQVLADATIRASVAFLLDHLPAALRLVIASRADPDLPLARLRARAQLGELRAAELRFTAADTAAFLREAREAPLAADEVAALAARTEGWAAGVQLATLALRGRDDHAAWLAGFTGGHRFLLDYVEEEILARQPDTTRRFLLQVAVLPRLGADLCAAVSGEPASRAILAGLERANLFVIPLDEGRRWYRLHDLFREALLARAAGEPGLLAEAHRRAAGWHAAHGDGREAIGHALAAGDHAQAADLIAREAPRLWLGGEARTVLGWLLALPDAVLWRRARLALDAALRLLEALHATADATYTEASLAVEQALGRVEDAVRATIDSPIAGAEVALLRGRLRLLRALIASRALLARGDAAGLARLAEELAGLAAGEEVRWQVIRLGLRFWLHFSLRHDGPRLLPQLLALKRRALGAGEHQVALTTTVWLAHVYEAAGQLHRTERECLAGLALVDRFDIQTASAGYLHLRLVGVYLAWNRLAEAAQSLSALLAIARTWQQVDQLIHAHYYRALLALLRGEPTVADAALREAEAIVQREQSTYHPPIVAAARAAYWLATGDLESAARWAARTPFDPLTWMPSRAIAFLARMRVVLAQRRFIEALTELDRFAAQLDQPGDVPTAIEYLALRLVALHYLAAREQAHAVAARLLALTEPEGWLRAYLDAGAPMEAALAALLVAPADEAAGAPALPRACWRPSLVSGRPRRRHRHRRRTMPRPRPRPSRPSPGASAKSCAISPTGPRTRRSPPPWRSP